MAISLVAVTNAPGSTSSVTSFATNVPAGVADGDLLIWTLVGNNVTVAPTPSGWNVWQANTTTGLNQSTFYRVASSEPSSYTATGLTSARWGSAMLALRGVDTTTPIDVTFPTRNAGTTALTYPAITPATAGAWVVAIGAVLASAQGTDIAWTAGNLDAVDTDVGSAVAAATNAFASHGHFAWTSGAFTPTGPATSPVGGLSRTIGATTAVRPSGAASQTGNINRLTSTGTARNVARTAGAVNIDVSRQTSTGVVRNLAATASGTVTRAINRLTSTGVPRTVVAGSIAPQSVAITRMLVGSTLRQLGAVAPTVDTSPDRLAYAETVIGTYAEPSVAAYAETSVGVWRDPSSTTYQEGPT